MQGVLYRDAKSTGPDADDEAKGGRDGKLGTGDGVLHRQVDVERPGLDCTVTRRRSLAARGPELAHRDHDGGTHS
jgi:hypothetical protein